MTLFGCPKETQIELKDGIEATYTFTFQIHGILKIMATDSSNKGITGMEVEIKGLDGIPMAGKYVTGADGSITTQLLPGTYIITEIVPPDNYTKASPAEQQVIVMSEGATVIFPHGEMYTV